jgi:hypothetical protein
VLPAVCSQFIFKCVSDFSHIFYMKRVNTCCGKITEFSAHLFPCTAFVETCVCPCVEMKVHGNGLENYHETCGILRKNDEKIWLRSDKCNGHFMRRITPRDWLCTSAFT